MRRFTGNRRRGVQTMKHDQNLRAVLHRVLRTRIRICILTGITICLSVVSALLPPLVLERVVNELTAGQNVSLSSAFFYLLLIAVSGLSEAGQNVMITVLGQKVTHGLRSALCEKLRFLPASYYTAHEAGKITSRFVNDVDTVDALFTNGIVSMFADACKVVSLLLIIFWKSTGLGLLMLLVLPLLFWMTRCFQKGMLQAQLANRAAISRVNNHVPETIRNIRMIHVLRCENYMEQKYDTYISDSYRATNQSNIYDSIYSPIVIFISSCVISVMMVCAAMGGGMRNFFGISVGTAVAVIAYVSKIFEPIESIGMEIQSIQSAVAGVQRINEFLAEPERVMPPQDLPDDSRGIDAGRGINGSRGIDAGWLPADSVIPAVQFVHVDFGYGTDRPVLQDLSFSVAKGEFVTFVGRTGAGKSTIFRLLQGLYLPQKGEVTIHGIPADQIPEARRRHVFGYVEQTFHPVAGTVGEQISLFDPEITQAQIEKAAIFTGLHETILALPQGYETPIGQAVFSQGQLQLLSIARAIAGDPEILLLDEITANLDSETERRVLDTLERAAQGHTVLSISHRLGECAHSGKILEIGSEISEKA